MSKRVKSFTQTTEYTSKDLEAMSYKYLTLKKALETIRDFPMESVDKNYLLIQIEGFKKCADNALKEIE